MSCPTVPSYIAVPDLDRSLAFYEPVLASIGINKVLVLLPGELPEMHGFGTDRPFFWLIADGRVGSNLEAVCHLPPFRSE